MNRLTLATLVAMVIAAMMWFGWVSSGQAGYGWFLGALLSTAAALSLVLIQMGPASRRRQRGFRVAAIWFGLLIGVAITELLAFAWPTEHLADNPWYLTTGEAVVADPDLPWARPPNLQWTGWSRGDLAMETNSADPEARQVTFETDADGFRNSETKRQADLIFLGDSFTEAGNVPESETFVSRVGQQLNQSVRNLGAAGYSAPSEWVVLQKNGLACNPRVVIWQIAETNDLDDAAFFIQWQQAGRPSVLPDFSAANISRTEAWKRRSPTYRLHDLWRPEEPWPFAGDFVDRQGQVHTLRFEMSFLPDTGTHPGWQVLAHYLATGAQRLGEEEIPLLVVMIPRKLRVMAPVCDIHEMTVPSQSGPMKIQHTLPEGWDLDPSQRLTFFLETLCSQLNVEYLDLTGPLSERAAAGDLVYLSMDTHLSPLGHQVVADAIAQRLKQMQ